MSWDARAKAADANDDDDIIVIDNLKRENVVIDYVWGDLVPFREFRDIRQLSTAEKQQAPKYLKPQDLRKKAIEAWMPKTYAGNFSEYNYDTKKVETVKKIVGLWDFAFKLLAIFRPEIAATKNYDAKNFLTTRICLNEGYQDGFCCCLAAIMCRCIQKARAAGHGINSGWFCCKCNPTACAIVHSVFHRHDIVSNYKERDDLAPMGYVLSKKTGK